VSGGPAHRADVKAKPINAAVMALDVAILDEFVIIIDVLVYKYQPPAISNSAAMLQA
jgi:hypothetical protein